MEKIRSKYTNPDYHFINFILSGDSFGIEVKQVREIARLGALLRPPHMPGFMEGFIEARGGVFPVIDLRKRFGLPVNVDSNTRVIIASFGSVTAGFVADRVNGINIGGKELRIKPRGARNAPWDGCVDAVIETGKGSVFILDMTKLLTGAEKELLGAV